MIGSQWSADVVVGSVVEKMAITSSGEAGGISIQTCQAASQGSMPLSREIVK